jgi:hypothetical protein
MHYKTDVPPKNSSILVDPNNLPMKVRILAKLNAEK